MSSGTESNSHFCCAPGMGRLQRIIGHSYCRGFSSFLLPTRGPGLGECGSGHPTQHSQEGPHSLDVYGNVSGQCQCSGRRCCIGAAALHPGCWVCAPHSSCAREGPEWAVLHAFGWKHRHWDGEGHMVQLQHFSGLDLWKKIAFSYNLPSKNCCSLTIRIQKYKEYKIESFPNRKE